MRNFVCGDTHIPHDYFKLYNRNWPEQRGLTKDDYLIILGDFGLCWLGLPDNEERYITKELQTRKFTTLFVDGNHENHDRLDALQEIDMFGGKVGVYADGIYHLKRGYVYTINGKTIFVFGGGASVDRVYRSAYIDWWPQEIQTKAQEEFAYDQLESVDWKVDYILTHVAPKSVLSRFKYIHPEKNKDPVSEFLDRILVQTQFKEWHFGHYHDDLVIEDQFYLHYNNKPLELT